MSLLGALEGGTENNEFIPGDPSDEVGGACRLPQTLGDRKQEIVAGFMAVAVVDRFEVVDVAEEHADISTVALALSNR